MLLTIAISVNASDSIFTVLGSNNQTYQLGEEIGSNVVIELRTSEYILVLDSRTNFTSRINGPYKGTISEYDSEKQKDTIDILKRVLQNPVSNCGEKELAVRGDECDTKE